MAWVIKVTVSSGSSIIWLNSRDGFGFWWHEWSVLGLNRGRGQFQILLAIQRSWDSSFKLLSQRTKAWQCLERLHSTNIQKKCHSCTKFLSNISEDMLSKRELFFSTWQDILRSWTFCILSLKQKEYFLRLCSWFLLILDSSERFQVDISKIFPR